MILPLRQRHRLWMLILAGVLPALFVAGLARRSSVPVNNYNAILSGPIKHRITGADNAAKGTKP